jgi:DNA-binding NarL/FixJ family response regulator
VEGSPPSRDGAIGVVDDDPRCIEAVRLTLPRPVIGFATARAALDALARRELPHVVLMDMSLPGEHAGPAISAMRRAGHLVVALTSHEDADFVFEALRAGAIGYVLKREAGGDLARVLDIVEAGGSPITPSVARRIVEAFREPGDVSSRVSERETEILRAFAEGLTYAQTASTLGISVDTVREHVRRVYDKLQVRSRSEAVLAALRRGLLG